MFEGFYIILAKKKPAAAERKSGLGDEQFSMNSAAPADPNSIHLDFMESGNKLLDNILDDETVGPGKNPTYQAVFPIANGIIGQPV